MSEVNILWGLPFALLLGGIAVLPFVNRPWWEKFYPFLAGGLGAIALAYYLFIRHDLAPWLHEMAEYVSFIVLLGALYIVSGGIVIHTSRKATPTANSVLLLLGAVLANLFGTTGASMLLIRPFLRMNKNHIKPYHGVFFIFLVSNVGGCLTPVGDPPLFLGYLRGVPFWWVFEHCWQPWLVATGLLLAIFFLRDTWDDRKQPRSHHHEHDVGPVVDITGIHNVLFILVIVAAVFRAGVFASVALLHQQGCSAGGIWRLSTSREILMIGAALASLLTTDKAIHHRNGFTYGPIREVAILFVGIFATMAPVLEYLETNAGKLPLQTPGQFYFAAGTLSAVLDNAPTYATFLQARLGELSLTDVRAAELELQRLAQTPALALDPSLKPVVRQAVEAQVRYHADQVRHGEVSRAQTMVGFLVGDEALNVFLVAISCGAVFFGACTYIGNGPNFMVKAIVESAGVPMPGFFGYIWRYTLPVLAPVYVLVWVMFFR